MILTRQQNPDFLDNLSSSSSNLKFRYYQYQRKSKLSMLSGPIRKCSSNKSAFLLLSLSLLFIWISLSVIIFDKPNNHKHCGALPCNKLTTSAPAVLQARMGFIRGRMGDQIELRSNFSSKGMNKNWTVYPKDMLEMEHLFLDHNRAACRIRSVYHVTVIIPTTADNYYRRMVVRSTWGNPKYLTDNPFTFSFVFMVGQPTSQEAYDLVEVEQRWYQDIVVGNFVDSYSNLTLKMLTAFTWVDKFCPDALFVIKADDDSYINLDIVSAILAEVDQKNAYGGRCQTNSTPVRNPKDKFYISKLEYPADKYPVFCEGPFYFMSSDVARKVSRLCFNYPYIKLEDVFMGACLVKNMNVTVFDLPHHVMPYSANNPRRVPRKAICVHKVSSGVLTQIYRKVHLQLHPKNFLSLSTTNFSKFLLDPSKDWKKVGANSEIVRFKTSNRSVHLKAQGKPESTVESLERLKKILKKKKSSRKRVKI